MRESSREDIFERILPKAMRVDAIGLLDATAHNPSSRITALTDTLSASAIEETASLARDVQTIGALLAAEVARRFRPELGYDGFAQSSGHRTPEAMIQAVTRAPYNEAACLVKVGGLLAEADAAIEASSFVTNTANGTETNDGSPLEPWSAPYPPSPGPNR